MKEIKVDLSENGISKLLKEINNLKANINSVGEEIVKDLADFTEKEIAKNLASTTYTDGNDDVEVFNKGKGTERTVGMSGEQALYLEYGTGTMGEKNMHPKRDSSLDWYNSGVTIRQNTNPKGAASKNKENPIPLNGLYWTYNKDGHKHYTQGIPAGLQVYNATLALKAKKTEIIKKKVSDALSKR